MKKLIILLISIGFFATSFSQDRIFFRNGEKILVHVISFSPEEVIYQYHYARDILTYTIPLRFVEKIIFEEGPVEEFYLLPWERNPSNKEWRKNEKELPPMKVTKELIVGLRYLRIF